jgi:hypothetical protein
MLSVLTTCMLTSEPEHRLDRNGRRVTTVRATCIDAQGGVINVSLITFSKYASADLEGLVAGDEIAVVGHASINRWQQDGKEQVGLNVKVTRVISHRDAGQHLLPSERRRSGMSAQPEAARQDVAVSGAVSGRS